MKSGENWNLSDESNIQIFQTLPAANYIIQEKKDGSAELYLSQIAPFQKVKKIFGDTNDISSRIYNTFKHRDNTTGILLVGEKGSGKTMLARELAMRLAEEDEIPTIVIADIEDFKFEKVKKLLQDIDQPACFIFDEFEKAFKRHTGQQEKLLTLLDGCFSGSKRLVIFTANDPTQIEQHFFNRPGRIFYRKDYTGISFDFADQYCRENLNSYDANIRSIERLLIQFDNFNFDMLQALVEEMNRYNEDVQTALKHMNINPISTEYGDYEVTLKKDGKVVKLDSDYFVIKASPLTSGVEVMAEDDYYWFDVNNIVEIDKGAGKYYYKMGDLELFLFKKPPQKYDFMKTL